MVEKWIDDISVELHYNPHVIKYFKDGMLQSIGLKDESLFGYSPRFQKYLEGEVRMKCSNTKKGRQTTELLYAYRLNFAAFRSLSLTGINHQQPYPLPPFDPETPENPEPVVISFNPTSITFCKRRNSEAVTLTLDEIGELSLKSIEQLVESSVQ